MILQVHVYENFTESGSFDPGYYTFKWSIVNVINFQGTLEERSFHIQKLESYIVQNTVEEEMQVQIP